MFNDKRSEVRQLVQLPGHFRTGVGAPRRMTVTELSPRGCRFYARNAHLAEGSFVTVTLDTIGFLDARVRWRNGAFYGITFSPALYVAVLDHLCRQFPRGLELSPG